MCINIVDLWLIILVFNDKIYLIGFNVLIDIFSSVCLEFIYENIVYGIILEDKIVFFGFIFSLEGCEYFEGCGCFFCLYFYRIFF